MPVYIQFERINSQFLEKTYINKYGTREKGTSAIKLVFTDLRDSQQSVPSETYINKHGTREKGTSTIKLVSSDL